MNDSLEVYLISVEYGDEYSAELQKIYKTIARDYQCNIIRVRTDQDFGRFVLNVNEAFEFSGYQEGLEIAIRECRARNEGGLNESRCTFVFVNDTWLVGHLRSLGLLLIKHMLQRRHVQGELSTFFGLLMASDDKTSTVIGDQSYISTWAFGLTASLYDMQGVRFYNEREICGDFKQNTLPSLAPEYRKFLESWLQPTNIFRGWYKAIPGVPLDDLSMERKSLTIYLEHSLPSRLALHGFEMVDISDLLPLFDAILINFLRRIDRINTLYLKLKMRLPAYFLYLFR